MIGSDAASGRPAAGVPRSAARRSGTGEAMAHHGEVLQGVFASGAARRLVPAVVSLPHPSVRAHARFEPAGPESPLEVSPAWKEKAARAARATLALLGAGDGGRLDVHSAIPTGRGLGSSTADVVSAVRAVADAYGRVLAPREVAGLAVASEQATDGVMFGSGAVLYANRDGYVMEELGGPLPRLDVLGFDAGGAAVETLGMPHRVYLPHEVARLHELLGTLRRAVARADPWLLGRVATGSARLNQRFLPEPRLALAEHVSAACGGVGVQLAHSGRVMAVLFDAARDTAAQLARARALLASHGIERCWVYRLEPDGAAAHTVYGDAPDGRSDRADRIDRSDRSDRSEERL